MGCARPRGCFPQDKCPVMILEVPLGDRGQALHGPGTLPTDWHRWLLWWDVVTAFAALRWGTRDEPRAALQALAPAAAICPCALLPSRLPTLEGGRAQLKIHPPGVPPLFLPVCFLPSWPCFSAWLPKKTKVTSSRFAYIYTHKHTHMCTCGWRPSNKL